MSMLYWSLLYRGVHVDHHSVNYKIQDFELCFVGCTARRASSVCWRWTVCVGVRRSCRACWTSCAQSWAALSRTTTTPSSHLFYACCLNCCRASPTPAQARPGFALAYSDMLCSVWPDLRCKQIERSPRCSSWTAVLPHNSIKGLQPLSNEEIDNELGSAS